MPSRSSAPAKSSSAPATAFSSGPPARESYFAQSRRPLAALAFVAPLVVLYEVGTAALHLDESGRRETRIVAFSWIRDAFELLGATGHLVAPLATIALLLGWHLFSRQPWRLRPTVPLAMAAESVLLAVPLMFAAAIVAAMARQFPPLAAVDLERVGGTAILGIGAGVYEELVFRLVGMTLLHSALCGVLGMTQRSSLVVSLVVTSIAFALYHHLPAGGEPLAWPPLAFRTLAGVWLGLVFVARGFGLAAGSHAAYDVLLSVLPLLTAPSAATT